MKYGDGDGTKSQKISFKKEINRHTKISRGLGFITFNKHESLEAIFEGQETCRLLLDGWEVQVIIKQKYEEGIGMNTSVYAPHNAKRQKEQTDKQLKQPEELKWQQQQHQLQQKQQQQQQQQKLQQQLQYK